MPSLSRVVRAHVSTIFFSCLLNTSHTYTEQTVPRVHMVVRTYFNGVTLVTLELKKLPCIYK